MIQLRVGALLETVPRISIADQSAIHVRRSMTPLGRLTMAVTPRSTSTSTTIQDTSHDKTLDSFSGGWPGSPRARVAQFALNADTTRTGGAPLLAVFEKRVSEPLAQWDFTPSATGSSASGPATHLLSPDPIPRRRRYGNCSSATAPATRLTRVSPGYGACSAVSPPAFALSRH